MTTRLNALSTAWRSKYKFHVLRFVIHRSPFPQQPFAERFEFLALREQAFACGPVGAHPDRGQGEEAQGPDPGGEEKGRGTFVFLDQSSDAVGEVVDLSAQLRGGRHRKNLHLLLGRIEMGLIDAIGVISFILGQSLL